MCVEAAAHIGFFPGVIQWLKNPLYLSNVLSNLLKIKEIVRRIRRQKPDEMLYAPVRILETIGKAKADKPLNYQFDQSAVELLIKLPPEQIKTITEMCKKLDYSWVGDYGMRLDDRGIVRAVPEGGPA